MDGTVRLASAVIAQRWYQSSLSPIREACLKLRYGVQKKVVVEDIECVFPLTDEAERDFFCRLRFSEEREAQVVRHILKQMRTSRCFIDVGIITGLEARPTRWL